MKAMRRQAARTIVQRSFLVATWVVDPHISDVPGQSDLNAPRPRCAWLRGGQEGGTEFEFEFGLGLAMLSSLAASRKA